VAFLVALFVGIFFHLLFDVMGTSTSGVLGSFFNYLSMRVHFDSISRGVVDSRDLVYFGSIITMGLYLAELMLSKRNWQS
jgi:ABC-2 type transport system permease protein